VQTSISTSEIEASKNEFSDNMQHQSVVGWRGETTTKLSEKQIKSQE
jgi:hypothetical protein